MRGRRLRRRRQQQRRRRRCTRRKRKGKNQCSIISSTRSLLSFPLNSPPPSSSSRSPLGSPCRLVDMDPLLLKASGRAGSVGRWGRKKRSQLTRNAPCYTQSQRAPEHIGLLLLLLLSRSLQCVFIGWWVRSKHTKDPFSSSSSPPLSFSHPSVFLHANIRSMCTHTTDAHTLLYTHMKPLPVCASRR